jgi:F-type H+-transporting ATPase subunit a
MSRACRQCAGPVHQLRSNGVVGVRGAGLPFHHDSRAAFRGQPGHEYERYVGYLTALGLFILGGCLIGLIPGFETATASPSVPLGCALVTWCYYHMHGIRKNGFGYIRNFIGPVWWLAPLMFVIEVCSHLARILSLTIRLFANMFASDMVTLVFFTLFPIAIPVIFMGLHAAVAIIQTYIFVLLATVYIGEAVAHEH